LVTKTKYMQYRI